MMNGQIDLFKYTQQTSTDWKWTMANDYPQKNGLKVFSCFACGGGSTMGYKLCGCEVLGCNEIDPRMNEVYVANHNPKYNYLEDIRDFNKREDLPNELYDLDILDGSFPCSPFSMAGKREKDWGKEKKFTEGQKMQTLDDLAFVFIETVAKLRPKVVIAENVKGILFGNAKKYVEKIYAQLNNIGYSVKHWVLKAEEMGVPQARHRVFFIATRLDFDLSTIDMSFNYKPITYGEIKTGVGVEINKKDGIIYQTLLKANKDDKTLCDTLKRTTGQSKWYQEQVLNDNSICRTVRGDSGIYRVDEKTLISFEDLLSISTFPQDFKNPISNSFWNLEYIVGMSVPPVMMKRVVSRLIDAGLFDYKLKN